jgi:DNA-binding response OmpR family regulator
MPEDKPQAPRILIVEDEPMLALTLQELLVSAGFAIAGVAGRLENALGLIESVACDAAILDANLANVSASPVAVALAARGVPFIVLSGYSPEQLQGAFPGAKFLRKPCRPALLLQAVNAILRQQ